MARHQVAQDLALLPAPDSPGRATRDRRRVDEGKEKEVSSVLLEGAEEPMPGPARDLPGPGEVHGPEVVADESRQRHRDPAREPPPRCDGGDPVRPDHVVTEETDTSGLDGARLGLGHVVQQGRELEDLAPAEAVAQELVQMLRQRLVHAREGRRARQKRVGTLEGAHARRPTRRSLSRPRRRAGRRTPRARRGTTVAGTAGRRPRRALSQEPHEPVAKALRGHAVERSGGAGRRHADGRCHAPAGANAELRGAECTHGVVVHGRRGAEPHRARAQIIETAQGIVDGALARGHEVVEGDGERVDGEVAPPEIALEVGRAEVHDVDLRSPPPSSRSGHETRGAARGVEDEKGPVESVGERARGTEGARWHGHVDVGGGLPAQEIPERAAHEVGGPRRPEDDVKRFEGLTDFGRQGAEGEDALRETRAFRHGRPRRRAALS